MFLTLGQTSYELKNKQQENKELWIQFYITAQRSKGLIVYLGGKEIPCNESKTYFLESLKFSTQHWNCSVFPIKTVVDKWLLEELVGKQQPVTLLLCPQCFLYLTLWVETVFGSWRFLCSTTGNSPVFPITLTLSYSPVAPVVSPEHVSSWDLFWLPAHLPHCPSSLSKFSCFTLWPQFICVQETPTTLLCNSHGIWIIII